MQIPNDREILRRFNEKVLRLESTALYKKYSESNPKVVAIMRDAKFKKTRDCHCECVAHIRSWVQDFNQDEIDAFVLTYRVLTQDNDQLSVGRLAEIYNRDWVPREAADKFRQARQQLNDYLDTSVTTVTVDRPITIRELLKVIIYGDLAHSNQSHAKTVRVWMGNGGLTGFFWAEFIAGLKEVTRYLQYFRELNVAVLAFVGR